MSSYESLELNTIKEKIAEYCAFSLGAAYIEQLKVETQALVIRRDLQRTKQAMVAVAFNGGLSFSGLKDIQPALLKAGKQGVLGIHDLVEVGLCIRGFELMVKQKKEIEVDLSALDDLFESLVFNVKHAEAIERCFSINDEVYDNASPALAQIRRSRRETQRRMTNETQSFMKQNKDSLASSQQTYRQDRQVVMVKPSDKNKIEGLVHGESASGQTVYIEPDFLVRYNNQIANLNIEEEDEIARICRELSARITEDAEILQADLETAALLDGIFAKAKWGYRHDGVIAELSEGDLRIEKARHPLIDPQAVVANSYHIEAPHRMVLISGPNTGGKSVALKTIGLFTLLTMCGCPVLAESAQIPLVDQVFVDIGDHQSIAQSLSTFSAHLSNIAEIIDHVSGDSLVLLDEIGGGTDPAEGESLAIAILEYLRHMGCMVVVTTHFGGLKNYGARHAEILSASVQFDLDSLQPTYHYIENLTGSSYAFEIARKLHLKASVVDQAQQIKEQNQSEQDRLIAKLERQTKATVALQETLEAREAQLNQEIASYAAKTAKLEAQRQQILAAFDQQQQDELEARLALADEYLEQLTQAQKPHEVQNIKQKIKQLQPQPAAAVSHGPLAIGDRVRLKQSSQVGVIREIDKRHISVSVGNLSVQVRAADVEKITASEVPKKDRRKQNRSVSISAGLRPGLECNVIGMHVEEAVNVVNKYLDSCVLYHLNNVRIVHGVGTGALRKAIHEDLRRNKHVRDFRLGGQGEGGVGATVVNLDD